MRFHPSVSLSHLLVAPERPDKWIMKDMWLGGEVALLYLFKAPLGVALVRKRVFLKCWWVWVRKHLCCAKYDYPSWLNTVQYSKDSARENIFKLPLLSCLSNSVQYIYMSQHYFSDYSLESGIYGCIYIQSPPEARVIACMDLHTVIESPGLLAAR